MDNKDIDVGEIVFPETDIRTWDTWLDRIEKGAGRFVIKMASLAVLVITFIGIMHQDVLSKTFGLDIMVSTWWVMLSLVVFGNTEYIRKNISFKVQSFWGLCLGICIGIWFVPENFLGSLVLFFVAAFVLVWETDKPGCLCDINTIITTLVTMLLSASLVGAFTAGFFWSLLPGLVFAAILVIVVVIVYYCVL